MNVVAALYVQRGGCYWGQPEVDPWDETRDARLYAGPWPVVAHPPCQRWGKYRHGSPLVIARTGTRKVVGDDNGCFEAAIAAVRKWGGVIEHPETSAAWHRFGIMATPPINGGWVMADWHGGWTCSVEQGYYGHWARKRTWLYACHTDLPSLRWGRAPGTFTLIDAGFKSTEERQKAAKKGWLATRGGGGNSKEREATPHAFRDLLLSIARSVRADRLAA